MVRLFHLKLTRAIDAANHIKPSTETSTPGRTYSLRLEHIRALIPSFSLSRGTELHPSRVDFKHLLLDWTRDRNDEKRIDLGNDVHEDETKWDSRILGCAYSTNQSVIVIDLLPMTW